MLAIAIAGLIVNVAALAVLAGAERDNLNIRAAALHVMGDLLGSAAANVAALIIILIGWLPADPLLSVLVALLILRSSFVVVKKSGHILLEGAPDELDTKTVAAELISEIPEIVGVHHVHAWSITQERPMMTLHARISSPPGAPATNFGAVVAAIKDRLAERFGVTHATVEIEHGEPD
jgi:cobalt-zinc-cadmium efflux system protein